TIGYFERYAICGDPRLDTGTLYVEHIWGEDGQNCGPIARLYTRNVFFQPSYWSDYPGGFDLGGPTRFPANYPRNYVTLPQIVPRIFECDPKRLQSFSVGGIQVLLMDGTARIVSSGISQSTWATAIDPQSGFPLGSNW